MKLANGDKVGWCDPSLFTVAKETSSGNAKADETVSGVQGMFKSQILPYSGMNILSLAVLNFGTDDNKGTLNTNLTTHYSDPANAPFLLIACILGLVFSFLG